MKFHLNESSNVCFCPFWLSMDLSNLRFFICISDRYTLFISFPVCVCVCFLLSPFKTPWIWRLVILLISSVSLNFKNLLPFIHSCYVLRLIPHPLVGLPSCNHNAIRPTYCLARFPCCIFHMCYFHVHLYDFLLLLFLAFLNFSRVKLMFSLKSWSFCSFMSIWYGRVCSVCCFSFLLAVVLHCLIIFSHELMFLG